MWKKSFANLKYCSGIFVEGPPLRADVWSQTSQIRSRCLPTQPRRLMVTVVQGVFASDKRYLLGPCLSIILEISCTTFRSRFKWEISWCVRGHTFQFTVESTPSYYAYSAFVLMNQFVLKPRKKKGPEKLATSEWKNCIQILKYCDKIKRYFWNVTPCSAVGICRSFGGT